VSLPGYSDAVDHWGFTEDATETLRLFRNGAAVEDQGKWFSVAPESATYRLEAVVERSGLADLSTRQELMWVFRSWHTEAPAVLPLSVIRFSPPLDLNNSAPVGASLRVPVTVVPQPGSATGPMAALRVEVSYDDGMTWQSAPVRSGKGGPEAVLTHPATARYVSLRATATDTAGNQVEQTIIHAYRLTSGAAYGAR
jgi:hypothetical protein